MPAAKKRPTIQRLVELQQLLLQFRAVQRQLHIPPTLDVRENDAEHSYALAMTAWFLAPYFPRLDRDKLIRYALAHDFVEIYAGDVMAYSDNATLASKRDREMDAAKRLRGEWPDFAGLHAAIQAYEDRADEEAKFIYALDKLTPALMDYLNEGRGWRYHGITFAAFCAEKNKKMPVSPDVYAYMTELFAILESQQHLFPAAPSQQR